MNPVIKTFSAKDDMISALSQETSQKLDAAISERGHASYVAAGGTTVPTLFSQLSQTDIAWDKVHVTLSDERWVEPGNINSNQHLVKSTLLQDKASTARFTPLWYDCGSPEKSAAYAHDAVKKIAAPFDVTLLGMGTDQHAASLFPNATGIKSAMDLSNPQMVCPIGPVNGAAGHESRLTLSLRAILNSRVIYIMIAGDKKWAALESALSSNDPIHSPVSAILHNDVCKVFVYWAQK